MHRSLRGLGGRAVLGGDRAAAAGGAAGGLSLAGCAALGVATGASEGQGSGLPAFWALALSMAWASAIFFGLSLRGIREQASLPGGLQSSRIADEYLAIVHVGMKA